MGRLLGYSSASQSQGAGAERARLSLPTVPLLVPLRIAGLYPVIPKHCPQAMTFDIPGCSPRPGPARWACNSGSYRQGDSVAGCHATLG